MRTVIILGGGESGWGSALLAKKEGYGVFLSDSGKLAARYREALANEGIEFEEGGHRKVYDLSPDEVIKSPGIPDTAPVVRHFSEKGIPVISEIEFAGRYSKGKTICITGSNGKTTTATLVYEILRAARYDVALSGNIGSSYAARVADGDREWYVLELSSFQLDGMYRFRPHIAVLLNITPDHLDRYGNDMGRYAASKMRITANQEGEDFLIYNASDTIIAGREELALSRAGKLPFYPPAAGGEGDGESGFSPLRGGACVENGIIIATAPPDSMKIPLQKIGIRGRHNAANAMAATLAALAAGVPKATVARVLGRFRGVEHRMEDAGTVGGVRFVNDSKATNTDAAWYALEGTPGRVVWIAGGTDKGNDYTELKKVAAGKVSALVCMGRDNGKLIDNFTGIVPAIYDTGSLDEAMKAAVGAARQGDTILLSPACASFDLFDNFEDRGRQFKEWVEEYRKQAEKS